MSEVPAHFYHYESLLATDLNGETKRLTTDSTGALRVNLVESISVENQGFASLINLFGRVIVSPFVETTLISYVVPASYQLQVTDVVGWGDTDGEFFIRRNGDEIGGFRTSPVERTYKLSRCSFLFNAGDVLDINSLHYADHNNNMKLNIFGGLRSI